MFEQRIKESPIIGLNGMGGGVTSYILYSAASSGGYEVSRSLRFNSTDSAYLSKTFSSSSNRRTWTWSGWVKRGKLGSEQNIFGTDSATGLYFQFESSDKFRLLDYTGSATNYQLRTTQVFRDPGAWMHLVFALDTTNSTADDRIKLYINGEQITTFDQRNNPSLNYEGVVNTNTSHTIGRLNDQYYCDLFLADVHFVDGQALAPTNFGELDSDNVWQPKSYGGTYGTNGFNLKFNSYATDADLGTDSSSNNNTWTVNNLVAAGYGLDTADQGFNVVTYTGTSSSQSITGVGFSPDFVWIKDRDNAYTHKLFDVIRGPNKVINSNTATAEATETQLLTSFDSDGFTVGTDGGLNQSGADIIAWCWKAGGTASSNTDGTETTSVSANTTYGFSVVTYTGTSSADTFGHGLGTVPKMIFFKARNASTNWNVYHDDGTNKRIFEGLNTNGNGSTTINSMSSMPSSTLLSLAGGGYSINSNSTTMVAYCWSEISGFSKFGSYTGDSPGGVTNTVTITTGFKPKFIIIKRVGNGSDGDTSYGGWGLYSYDTSSQLMANCSGAEGIRGNCSGTTNLRSSITFNVDGFSVSTPWYELNDDNVEYVYAAFAEKPDGSIIDSLIDTPTNYSADSDNNGGNYATLNPLAISPNSTPTVSNGNLEIERTSVGSVWTNCGSTFPVSSGKYYWELSLPTINGTIARWGVADADDYEFNRDTSGTGLPWLGSGTGTSWSMDVGGNTYHNGSTVSSSYTSTVTTNDIIGVALDCDANTLTFYKNGTSLGVAHSNVTASRLVPAISLHGSGHNKAVFNFGQRPFAYTPPTNHLSICTQNLSDPAISDGSTAMDVVTYTGNGSTQTISGFEFSPDFVWVKQRNTSRDHRLANIISGTGKDLRSNATNAEVTDANGITAFNSDGFSVGSSTGWNQSSGTYVSWAWDAGSSTVSNTDGSITSSVRANQTAGFSIVQWNNGGGGSQNVGHGLDAEPEFWIHKPLDTSGSWFVYHKGIGTGKYLRLESTNAEFGSLTYWTPTSTTMTIATNVIVGSTTDMIAYCYSSVDAYNSFGTYQGNGVTDGPFVYTGHRSRFIMIKRTDSTGDWLIYDTARDEANTADKRLYPNLGNAEAAGSGQELDILSNGFKIKGGANANYNASGGSYVYASFAEHPFRSARAR